jgi:MFS transporter, DHA1 family, multidrug resistance protein
LRELGEDEGGAAFWSGVTHAVSTLALVVATPLWGVLSDRVSRKMMVLRAIVGTAVAMGLIGLATHAWQVLVLRTAQGATSGTNAAMVPLAADAVPPSRMTSSMGLLQTAQFLGVAVGPLIGGLSSAVFGLRGMFTGSAIGLLVMVPVFYFLVREPARARVDVERTRGLSLRERLLLVMRARSVQATFAVVVVFQTAYGISQTLLALHIQAVAEAAGGGAEVASGDVVAAVGIVVTMTALGVAAGASVLGWAGGRLGVHYVALGCLVAGALLAPLQTGLSEIWQFSAVRFALGFAAGGVMPCLRAHMAMTARSDPELAPNIGAIYGLVQSSFSLGSSGGAVLSSVVASIWSIPATHVASGVAFGVAALFWLILGRART